MNELYADMEKRYGAVPSPNEMDKLIEYLKIAPPENYTYSITECWGRPQVIFMTIGEPSETCDVVCHAGSYGHKVGLMEAMGAPLCQAEDDSVEGWLTALTVMARVHGKTEEEMAQILGET